MSENWLRSTETLKRQPRAVRQPRPSHCNTNHGVHRRLPPTIHAALFASGRAPHRECLENGEGAVLARRKNASERNGAAAGEQAQRGRSRGGDDKGPARSRARHRRPRSHARTRQQQVQGVFEGRERQ
jgi:hypothetical protein